MLAHNAATNGRSAALWTLNGHCLDSRRMVFSKHCLRLRILKDLSVRDSHSSAIEKRLFTNILDAYTDRRL